MSFTQDEKFLTMIASTDMRSHQHHVVELNATDLKVELGAAKEGFGIVANNPNAGEAAMVAIDGVTLIRVGAAVTRGQWLTSAATGWGTQVTSGAAQNILGRVITGAASGMLASILLRVQRVNTAV